MYNYEEIKQQVASVIHYSQGIANPDVEPLLRNWKLNKEKFIELFGGLIYEYPEKVTFHLSPEEKSEKVNHFIDKVRIDHSETLSYFLDVQKDGFFDNVVVIDVPLNDKTTIKTGSKLIKAFKYFITDKVELRSLQDEASLLIQEDKIEGHLCLSVHPLDFLSSSENTLKWRSCHALDGDFRAGNLSYIGDKSTFIAYIKTSEDAYLPNFPFPWNNKKWRTLFFVSNDNSMIFAGRSYPFPAMEILNFIKDKVLLEELNFGHSENWWSNIQWTPWCNEQIREIPYNGETIYLDPPMIPIGRDSIKPITKIIRDCPDPLHFNDLLNSSCYVPYYSCVKYGWWGSWGCENTTKVEVGSRVLCLHCGREYITESGLMVCDNCESDGYEISEEFCDCCNCGRHMRVDKVNIQINGEPLCDNCANDSTSICCRCHQRFFYSDLRYSPEGDICDNCKKEMEDEDNGS